MSGGVRRYRCGENASDMRNLVIVDGMAEAGIDALRHVASQAAQDLRGFVHARQRNMEVDVAAADEHRRARQCARIIPRRARWADQAGAQPHRTAVAAGVTRRVFEGEAAALREPEQYDAIR